MKKTIKKMGTLFLVMLLFATTIVAQTKNWSAVAQDETKPNAGYFKTGAEYVNWLRTAKVPTWIVPYDGCEVPCQTEINSVGSRFCKEGFLAIINESNNETHFFKNGVITNADMTEEMWKKIEGTLFVAEVDFGDAKVQNLAVSFNQKTGVYLPSWVEHTNLGKQYCLFSKQGNKIFLVARASCGQPFSLDDIKLFSQNSMPTDPANPGPGPGTSPGPGANPSAGTGNGLTFEQVMVLAEKLKPTMVVYAGNNNGNNNGGSVTGGGGLVSTLPKTVIPDKDEVVEVAKTVYVDAQGVPWTRSTSTDQTGVNRSSVTTTTTTQQQPLVYAQQQQACCGNAQEDLRIQKGLLRNSKAQTVFGAINTTANTADVIMDNLWRFGFFGRNSRDGVLSTSGGPADFPNGRQ